MKKLRNYFDVLDLAKKYNIDASILCEAYSIGSEKGYLDGHIEGYETGWDLGSRCCKSQLDWAKPISNKSSNDNIPKSVKISVSGYTTADEAERAIIRYTNIDAVTKGYEFFKIISQETALESDNMYSFSAEYKPSNTKEIGYIRSGFPQMGPMLSEKDMVEEDDFPYTEVISGTGFDTIDSAKECAMKAIFADMNNKGYNRYTIKSLVTPKESDGTYSFHLKYGART